MPVLRRFISLWMTSRPRSRALRAAGAEFHNNVVTGRVLAPLAEHNRGDWTLKGLLDVLPVVFHEQITRDRLLAARTYSTMGHYEAITMDADRVRALLFCPSPRAASAPEYRRAGTRVAAEA